MMKTGSEVTGDQSIASSEDSSELPSMRGHLAVLDDESSFCEFVEYVGRKCGFDVFATTQPRLFLDHLDRQPAAVIVLDLHMPEADGLAVLRHLAKAGVTSSILIASGSDERVMDSALQLGRAHGLSMGGIIHKPIRQDALRAQLESQVHVDDLLSPERLKAALAANELTLHYQPQLDLQAGVVVGVEALMRWWHPRFGLVMPAAFIPMAEQSGLIGLLTDWALTEAVRQAALWQGSGHALNIAVNISIAGVPDEGLPERLERMCLTAGIPPSAISLELTESGAMRDPSRLMEMLGRFRLKGFELSIDDFGTGYSSLVHLQCLPFSSLKIDRVFVASMLESSSSASIVIATIGLAHALGLKCIAEGVESAAVMDFLRENGCDYAQGYYIARPMPAADMPAFVADRHARMDERYSG